MGEAVLTLATAAFVALLAASPAAAGQEGAAPSVAAEAPLESTVEPPVEPAAAPVVTAIEIRSDAPLRDRAEVRSLIAFSVGDRLTEPAVERTLRNLRAGGLAETAAIYRRPAAPGTAAGGVVAVVVLTVAIEVEAVRIEGDTGALARSDLLRLVPQRSGAPLVSDQVVRGVFRLQDELRDAGYFERSVRVQPRIDEERKRAVVVFRVEAGTRATVGEVGFEGGLGPFGSAELLAPLRLKPGQPYRRRAAEADAERLQQWLVTEQEHRQATVGDPRSVYDPADHTVALTFPIEVGPRVLFEVEGAEVKKLRKAGLLPFLGEEGYDEALLLQAVDGIEAYYQRRGHYQARVTSNERTQGEDEREGGDATLTVTLTVEPGPEFTLRTVRFEGNRSFGDGALRELMVTGERNVLTVGSGRLVDSVLDDDLDNIRSFYRLRGFTEVAVGPPAIERSGAEGRDLALTVPIVEGTRLLVGGLDFEGVSAFEPEKLARRIPLEAGGPYHPLLLEQSLEAVRIAYAREGYDSAQVSARRSVSEPEESADGAVERRVDVVVEVLEGPRTVLDRVIVRGNQKTDEAVIRRAVGVERGAPVSGSLLLEIERRLFGLGIFTRAEAELTPAPLGATTRDLLIRVEEGQTRRLTYGFGYDTEDGAGGILGYSHGNLFGKGMRLTGDAQVREENQRFRLLLDHPYAPLLRVPMTYSVFRTEQRRETIDVTKVGTRVEAVKSFDRLRLALAYQYQNVSNAVIAAPRPGTPGEPDPAPREDQTLRISSLAPSLLIDRRDDPIDPTRGWSFGAELEWAFPFPFAAEADSLKLQVQQTALLDLGLGLGDGPWVLAASVRAGGIEPLGRLDLDDPFIPPGLDLPSSQVFVAERFFGGGRNSHRAFERDRLGIPGQTLFADAAGDLVPAGGNGLLLVNVDLRFPLFGALGGTLFYDTGNVWADWRDLDPSELRDGAGVGLRYLSPIGPLRFEIGWPLDRLTGDKSPVFHFSLGYGF